MGGRISDFRSGEALGDHKVFRDKCDGEQRQQLLEMKVKEARGQGVDMFEVADEDNGRLGSGEKDEEVGPGGLPGVREHTKSLGDDKDEEGGG